MVIMFPNSLVGFLMTISFCSDFIQQVCLTTMSFLWPGALSWPQWPQLHFRPQTPSTTPWENTLTEHVHRLQWGEKLIHRHTDLIWCMEKCLSNVRHYYYLVCVCMHVWRCNCVFKKKGTSWEKRYDPQMLWLEKGLPFQAFTSKPHLVPSYTIWKITRS